ncbi:MAG: D-glycero-alpha-D-manno-heptose-1,7-bisphosphate 7-phosphatase [Thermoplasmatota archaeon]
MAKPVVFLDRDGVLVKHVQLQLRNLDGFAMEPGAAEAVARLNKWAHVFVTTNQRGVGLGWTKGSSVDQIHDAMVAELKKKGARLDGIYQCRHAPFLPCRCAKPKPGMLEQAAKDHALLGYDAWMVGDQIKDARAAVAYGATPILVTTSRSREELEAQCMKHGIMAAIVPDLAAAVDLMEAA